MYKQVSVLQTTQVLGKLAVGIVILDLSEITGQHRFRIMINVANLTNLTVANDTKKGYAAAS